MPPEETDEGMPSSSSSSAGDDNTTSDTDVVPPKDSSANDNNDDDNNNGYEMECMLEFFPLSRPELEIVLEWYQRYQQQQKALLSSNDDTNNNKLPAFETIFHSLLLPTVLSSSPTSDENNQDHQNHHHHDHILSDEEYRERLIWSGHEFVPETGHMIQCAIQNVFLIGTPSQQQQVSQLSDGNEDDGDGSINYSTTNYDTSPKWQFIEAISSLLGRRGSRTLLQLMYQVTAAAVAAETAAAVATVVATTGVVATSSSSVLQVHASSLIDITYRLLVATWYLQTGTPTTRRRTIPINWIRSLSSSCSSSSSVSMSQWMNWTQSIACQTYQILSTFCHVALFGPYHPFRTTTTPPFRFPHIVVLSGGGGGDDNFSGGNDDTSGGGSCALWTVPYQSVPSSLAILSPNLGTTHWVPLYSSDYDGFNFRAMQDHILSYHGPTVMLIQTTTGDCFGYYTDCPWKESKHWYGDGSTSSANSSSTDNDNDNNKMYESFIFGIKPTLQYYGVEGEKPYRMFLRNPVYPHPGDVAGLAIGGVTEKTPRILISTTFEHCKAGVMDAVYQTGPLLSDGELFFDIDVIEVFAVTSSHHDYEIAVKEGRARAAIREGTRIKVAQVDRKQFLDDFRSGDYINKLFDHRGQVRGRHSFVAHDEEDSGYYIEHKQPSLRFLVSPSDGDEDGDNGDDSSDDDHEDNAAS